MPSGIAVGLGVSRMACSSMSASIDAPDRRGCPSRPSRPARVVGVGSPNDLQPSLFEHARSKADNERSSCRPRIDEPPPRKPEHRRAVQARWRRPGRRMRVEAAGQEQAITPDRRPGCGQLSRRHPEARRTGHRLEDGVEPQAHTQRRRDRAQESDGLRGRSFLRQSDQLGGVASSHQEARCQSRRILMMSSWTNFFSSFTRSRSWPRGFEIEPWPPRRSPSWELAAGA